MLQGRHAEVQAEGILNADAKLTVTHVRNQNLSPIIRINVIAQSVNQELFFKIGFNTENSKLTTNFEISKILLLYGWISAAQVVTICQEHNKQNDMDMEKFNWDRFVHLIWAKPKHNRCHNR